MRKFLTGLLVGGAITGSAWYLSDKDFSLATGLFSRHEKAVSAEINNGIINNIEKVITEKKKKADGVPAISKTEYTVEKYVEITSTTYHNREDEWNDAIGRMSEF